ncbi:MAG: sodium-dependent bicarbonate transport family permease [Pseudomonadota bacterium]
MSPALLSNLLDPPILFFLLGTAIGLLRSNLDVPQPVAKFLSLYLLMAIGFKGGVALSKTGVSPQMGLALTAAVILALGVPLWTYALLRRRLSTYDAAAVAATYGSVSAVTFIAANQFLERQGIAFGPYMTVALVIMESPAIVMAVLLANLARKRMREQGELSPASSRGAPSTSLGDVVREAFTDGAHLLLIGSLFIGWLSGDAGQSALKPFIGDVYKGLLCFFLLDMGLLVSRRLRELPPGRPFLLAFGIGVPLVNASVALGLALLFGLGTGDATLLMVLGGSASYIVVPAVLRHAIPEANPGLYFGLALGITFPFNMALGVPLYLGAAQTAMGWLG